MSSQQMLLGVGASAKKTYADDLFSTYLYTGTGSAKSVNNGIDLAGEGGMTWIKQRHGTTDHVVTDTVRGAGNRLRTNVDAANQNDNAYLSAFNNNGFSLGTDADVNSSGNDFASWSFRKAPGFFDIVTWTGNGTAPRTISHNLGCVPGMIIVKETGGTEDWTIYHRTAGAGNKMRLNSTSAVASTSSWNSVIPTAASFTVGDVPATNANTQTYVAYLFAGGESTAATARSVTLDGSNDAIKTSTSSDYDFGTGDFTVEFWIRCHNLGDVIQTADHRTPSVQSGHWVNYIKADGSYTFWKDADKIVGKKLEEGQWYHIATVRHSGTTSLYIDGVRQGNYTDTNDYSNQRIIFGLHGPDEASFDHDGDYSNIRIVKGTAVYTSSFKPPTAPLTNITNTKFLGANSSTVTGTTVGSAVSVGNPTASIDSPFDDPAGFIFGENEDQNMVKVGSYTGASYSSGLVELGWEPQWLLIKNSEQSSDWLIIDNMRGTPTWKPTDMLFPNNYDVENSWSSSYINFHPTGFSPANTGNTFTNSTGKVFYYLAIRRPDGYVGKPASAGTDVFDMDLGNGNAVPPAFDSGFPVDFRIAKKHASNNATFYLGTRLGGETYLTPHTSAVAENSGSWSIWDSNAGDGISWDSDYTGWMWKRGQGFDVVAYQSIAPKLLDIPHNLGRVPEMIWVKNRTAADNWIVYHKGFNDGTNPEQYYILLNGTSATSQYDVWRDIAPTSTHFCVNDNHGVNSDDIENYFAYLFASVNGISKLGYWTGTGSEFDISFGFSPRFILIKRIDSSSYGDWYMYDTPRGWSNSAPSWQQRLSLQNEDAMTSCGSCLYPNSTGVTISTSTRHNTSGGKYIYYAHA